MTWLQFKKVRHSHVSDEALAKRASFICESQGSERVEMLTQKIA